MPAFSLAVSRGPTTPSPKARYSVFLPPFGGRARSLPVSLAAFLGAAPTLIWPGSHTRWRYKGGYYPPRGAQTSRPQVAMGTALPAFFVSTIFPFGRGQPLGTGNLAVHQPIDTLDGQKRVRLCCGYDPSSGMLHGKPRRSLHAPRRGDHLLKHVEIIRYVALAELVNLTYGIGSHSTFLNRFDSVRAVSVRQHRCGSTFIFPNQNHSKNSLRWMATARSPSA